ncbi:bifunctional methylthioribulose-1-phosphate dehydratase/enolase-phosphatase E1 1 [Pyrus ussuriensis x Pyrus communis]|uniref:Bifunctional methylthioribulose-1-phosphate dehydratase/enolase-phosphatase E1 1 n=1 Tax=Pyrus ussuriensis x Pyrus communis TaxID=2448454 RepID=A0A5N5FVS9_9ROSA|nr:bifunctional methylthioribulose-1-phosphate dehydratase/enolase-phosphatase E1 1 [Pyrus ussuriensis x Pyrus communis]
MVAVAVNGLKLGTTSQAYLEGKTVSDSKVLISDLCRQFYNLGWVSGTGGNITIKVHDDPIPKPEQLVVMSPSGCSWILLKLLKFVFCLFFWLFALWVYVISTKC